MDGTVVYLSFNNKEIGYPLSKQEHETFFKIKYSYDLNSIPDVKIYNNEEKKVVTNLKFIENIEVLLAQEQEIEKKKQEVKPKQQQQQLMQQPLFVLSESSSSNSQFKSSDVRR
jgi:hypothetical protein